MKSRVARYAFLYLLAAHLSIFTLIGEWWSSAVPLANDNLNLTLPYRAFLVDSVRSGNFPFWDPYSAGGTQTVSIYMSTFVNPVVLLLALAPWSVVTSFILEIYFYAIIGFAGMWFWIGRDVHPVVKGLAAITWVNSSFVVFQFHLNIEVAVTTMFFPWLMIGLTMKDGSLSARSSALSLGLLGMLTSGYLGLVPFVLYSVLFFVVVNVIGELVHVRGSFESLFQRTVTKTKVAQFVGTAGTTSILLLLALSIPITETFANLDRSVFLDRTIDPFVASMHWESLASLFSSDGLNAFVPRADGGHTASLFLPTIMILGIGAGMVRPGRRFVASLATAVALFAMALSSSSIVGRWAVEHVPLLNDVRFHVFAVGLILFFAITAAVDGIAVLSRFELRSLLLGLGVLLGTYLLTRKSAPLLVSRRQVLLTVLCLMILMVLFWKSRQYGRAFRVCFASAIVALSCLQVYFTPKTMPIPLLNVDPLVRLKSFTALEDGVMRSSSDVPQERVSSFEDLSRFGDMKNQHILSATPVINSYTPQIHPVMNRLLASGDESVAAQLTGFFVLNAITGHTHLRISKLEPDRVDLEIHGWNESGWLQSTIPFSPHWNAHAESEEELQLGSNSAGFMKIFVPEGVRRLRLHYSPSFRWMLYIMTLVGWLTLLALSIKAVRTVGNSTDKNRCRSPQRLFSWTV